VAPLRIAEPLRLVHHHPGRLRVRADVLRGEDSQAAADLRAALTGVAGVLRVVHSPFTGSVLIEYEPGQVEPDALLARASQAAGLDGVVDEASLPRDTSAPARNLAVGARVLNEVTRALSGGRTDLNLLVPAALFGAAIASFLKEPVLPRWDNLLWWSYSTFRDLNHDAVKQAGQVDLSHLRAESPQT
jgi:hypothetical protein